MAPRPFWIHLIIWTLVILGVYTAPNRVFGRPPQDLICASDRISGYVDQSGINREHWMRIGVKADSLHECARRCYEYIFCYSITFDITQKRPCIFYLHAATHCQGKQLTPIDKLNQDGPVTIECMKCMSDEEVVTLGLTTTTPLTTKKSEETPKIEFSHDEEAKQHKGHAQSSIDNPKLVLTPKDELTNKDIEDALKSKSIPATLGPGRGCVVTFQVDTQTSPDSLSTTETATVINANQCAYICFQNACTRAIFVPNTDEAGKSQCKLDFKDKEICSADRQTHYHFTTDKAVILSCFRCASELPTTISPLAELGTTSKLEAAEINKAVTSAQPNELQVTTSSGVEASSETPNITSSSGAETSTLGVTTLASKAVTPESTTSVTASTKNPTETTSSVQTSSSINEFTSSSPNIEFSTNVEIESTSKIPETTETGHEANNTSTIGTSPSKTEVSTSQLTSESVPPENSTPLTTNKPENEFNLDNVTSIEIRVTANLGLIEPEKEESTTVHTTTSLPLVSTTTSELEISTTNVKTESTSNVTETTESEHEATNTSTIGTTTPSTEVSTHQLTSETVPSEKSESTSEVPETTETGHEATNTSTIGTSPPSTEVSSPQLTSSVPPEISKVPETTETGHETTNTSIIGTSPPSTEVSTSQLTSSVPPEISKVPETTETGHETTNTSIIGTSPPSTEVSSPQPTTESVPPEISQIPETTETGHEATNTSTIGTSPPSTEVSSPQLTSESIPPENSTPLTASKPENEFNLDNITSIEIRVTANPGLIESEQEESKTVPTTTSLPLVSTTTSELEISTTEASIEEADIVTSKIKASVDLNVKNESSIEMKLTGDINETSIPSSEASTVESTTISQVSTVSVTETSQKHTVSEESTTSLASKTATNEATTIPIEETTTARFETIQESLSEINKTLEKFEEKLEKAEEKLNGTEEAVTTEKTFVVTQSLGTTQQLGEIPENATTEILHEETNQQAISSTENLVTTVLASEVPSTTEAPTEIVKETLTVINKTLETLDETLEKIKEELNTTKEGTKPVSESPAVISSTTTQASLAETSTELNPTTNVPLEATTIKIETSQELRTTPEPVKSETTIQPLEVTSSLPTEENQVKTEAPTTIASVAEAIVTSGTEKSEAATTPETPTTITSITEANVTSGTEKSEEATTPEASTTIAGVAEAIVTSGTEKSEAATTPEAPTTSTSITEANVTSGTEKSEEATKPEAPTTITSITEANVTSGTEKSEETTKPEAPTTIAGVAEAIVTSGTEKSEAATTPEAPTTSTSITEANVTSGTEKSEAATTPEAPTTITSITEANVTSGTEKSEEATKPTTLEVQENVQTTLQTSTTESTRPGLTESTESGLTESANTIQAAGSSTNIPIVVEAIENKTIVQSEKESPTTITSITEASVTSETEKSEKVITSTSLGPQENAQTTLPTLTETTSLKATTEGLLPESTSIKIESIATEAESKTTSSSLAENITTEAGKESTEKIVSSTSASLEIQNIERTTPQSTESSSLKTETEAESKTTTNSLAEHITTIEAGKEPLAEIVSSTSASLETQNIERTTTPQPTESSLKTETEAVTLEPKKIQTTETTTSQAENLTVIIEKELLATTNIPEAVSSTSENLEASKTTTQTAETTSFKQVSEISMPITKPASETGSTTGSTSELPATTQREIESVNTTKTPVKEEAVTATNLGLEAQQFTSQKLETTTESVHESTTSKVEVQTTEFEPPEFGLVIGPGIKQRPSNISTTEGHEVGSTPNQAIEVTSQEPEASHGVELATSKSETTLPSIGSTLKENGTPEIPITTQQAEVETTQSTVSESRSSTIEQVTTQASTAEAPIEVVKETLTGINKTLESLDETLEKITESLNATKEEEKTGVEASTPEIPTTLVPSETTTLTEAKTQQPVEEGTTLAPSETTTLIEAKTQQPVEAGTTLAPSETTTLIEAKTQKPVEEGTTLAPSETSTLIEAKSQQSVEEGTTLAPSETSTLIEAKTQQPLGGILAQSETTTLTEAKTQQPVEEGTTLAPSETSTLIEAKSQQSVEEGTTLAPSETTTLVEAKTQQPIEGTTLPPSETSTLIEAKTQQPVEAGTTLAPSETTLAPTVSSTVQGNIISTQAVSTSVLAEAQENGTVTEVSPTTSLPKSVGVVVPLRFRTTQEPTEEKASFETSGETTTESLNNDETTSNLPSKESTTSSQPSTMTIETSTSAQISKNEEVVLDVAAKINKTLAEETEKVKEKVEEDQHALADVLNKINNTLVMEETLEKVEEAIKGTTTEKSELQTEKVKEKVEEDQQASSTTIETSTSAQISKSEEVVLDVAAKINKTLAEEAEKVKEKVEEVQHTLADVLNKINNTLVMEETLEKVEEAIKGTTTEKSELHSSEVQNIQTEATTHQVETATQLGSEASSPKIESTTSKSEEEEGVGLMVELKPTEKHGEKSTGIPIVQLETSTIQEEHTTQPHEINVSLANTNESWAIEQKLVTAGSPKVESVAKETSTETSTSGLETGTQPQSTIETSRISEATTEALSTKPVEHKEATTSWPEILEETSKPAAKGAMILELAEDHEVPSTISTSESASKGGFTATPSEQSEPNEALLHFNTITPKEGTEAQVTEMFTAKPETLVTSGTGNFETTTPLLEKIEKIQEKIHQEEAKVNETLTELESKTKAEKLTTASEEEAIQSSTRTSASLEETLAQSATPIATEREKSSTSKPFETAFSEDLTNGTAKELLEIPLPFTNESWKIEQETNKTIVVPEAAAASKDEKLSNTTFSVTATSENTENPEELATTRKQQVENLGTTQTPIEATEGESTTESTKQATTIAPAEKLTKLPIDFQVDETTVGITLPPEISNVTSEPIAPTKTTTIFIEASLDESVETIEPGKQNQTIIEAPSKIRTGVVAPEIVSTTGKPETTEANTRSEELFSAEIERKTTPFVKETRFEENLTSIAVTAEAKIGPGVENAATSTTQVEITTQPSSSLVQEVSTQKISTQTISTTPLSPEESIEQTTPSFIQESGATTHKSEEKASLAPSAKVETVAGESVTEFGVTSSTIEAKHEAVTVAAQTSESAQEITETTVVVESSNPPTVLTTPGKHEETSTKISEVIEAGNVPLVEISSQPSTVAAEEATSHGESITEFGVTSSTIEAKHEAVIVATQTSESAQETTGTTNEIVNTEPTKSPTEVTEAVTTSIIIENASTSRTVEAELTSSAHEVTSFKPEPATSPTGAANETATISLTSTVLNENIESSTASILETSEKKLVEATTKILEQASTSPTSTPQTEIESTLTLSESSIKPIIANEQRENISSSAINEETTMNGIPVTTVPSSTEQAVTQLVEGKTTNVASEPSTSSSIPSEIRNETTLVLPSGVEAAETTKEPNITPAEVVTTSSETITTPKSVETTAIESSTSSEIAEPVVNKTELLLVGDIREKAQPTGTTSIEQQTTEKITASAILETTQASEVSKVEEQVEVTTESSAKNLGQEIVSTSTGLPTQEISETTQTTAHEVTTLSSKEVSVETITTKLTPSTTQGFTENVVILEMGESAKKSTEGPTTQVSEKPNEAPTQEAIRANVTESTEKVGTAAPTTQVSEKSNEASTQEAIQAKVIENVQESTEKVGTAAPTTQVSEKPNEASTQEAIQANIPENTLKSTVENVVLTSVPQNVEPTTSSSISSTTSEEGVENKLIIILPTTPKSAQHQPTVTTLLKVETASTKGETEEELFTTPLQHVTSEAETRIEQVNMEISPESNHTSILPETVTSIAPNTEAIEVTSATTEATGITQLVEKEATTTSATLGITQLEANETTTTSATHVSSTNTERIKAIEVTSAATEAPTGITQLEEKEATATSAAPGITQLEEKEATTTSATSVPPPNTERIKEIEVTSATTEAPTGITQLEEKEAITTSATPVSPLNTERIKAIEVTSATSEAPTGITQLEANETTTTSATPVLPLLFSNDTGVTSEVKNATEETEIVPVTEARVEETIGSTTQAITEATTINEAKNATEIVPLGVKEPIEEPINPENGTVLEHETSLSKLTTESMTTVVQTTNEVQPENQLTGLGNTTPSTLHSTVGELETTIFNQTSGLEQTTLGTTVLSKIEETTIATPISTLEESATSVGPTSEEILKTTQTPETTAEFATGFESSPTSAFSNATEKSSILILGTENESETPKSVAISTLVTESTTIVTSTNIEAKTSSEGFRSTASEILLINETKLESFRTTQGIEVISNATKNVLEESTTSVPVVSSSSATEIQGSTSVLPESTTAVVAESIIAVTGTSGTIQKEVTQTNALIQESSSLAPTSVLPESTTAAVAESTIAMTGTPGVTETTIEATKLSSPAPETSLAPEFILLGAKNQTEISTSETTKIFTETSPITTAEVEVSTTISNLEQNLTVVTESKVGPSSSTEIPNATQSTQEGQPSSTVTTNTQESAAPEIAVIVPSASEAPKNETNTSEATILPLPSTQISTAEVPASTAQGSTTSLPFEQSSTTLTPVEEKLGVSTIKSLMLENTENLAITTNEPLATTILAGENVTEIVTLSEVATSVPLKISTAEVPESEPTSTAQGSTTSLPFEQSSTTLVATGVISEIKNATEEAEIVPTTEARVEETEGSTAPTTTSTTGEAISSATAANELDKILAQIQDTLKTEEEKVNNTMGKIAETISQVQNVLVETPGTTTEEGSIQTSTPIAVEEETVATPSKVDEVLIKINEVLEKTTTVSTETTTSPSENLGTTEQVEAIKSSTKPQETPSKVDEVLIKINEVLENVTTVSTETTTSPSENLETTEQVEAIKSSTKPQDTTLQPESLSSTIGSQASTTVQSIETTEAVVLSSTRRQEELLVVGEKLEGNISSTIAVTGEQLVSTNESTTAVSSEATLPQESTKIPLIIASEIGNEENISASTEATSTITLETTSKIPTAEATHEPSVELTTSFEATENETAIPATTVLVSENATESNLGVTEASSTILIEKASTILPEEGNVSSTIAVKVVSTISPPNESTTAFSSLVTETATPQESTKIPLIIVGDIGNEENISASTEASLTSTISPETTSKIPTTLVNTEATHEENETAIPVTTVLASENATASSLGVTEAFSTILIEKTSTEPIPSSTIPIEVVENATIVGAVEAKPSPEGVLLKENATEGNLENVGTTLATVIFTESSTSLIENAATRTHEILTSNVETSTSSEVLIENATTTLETSNATLVNLATEIFSNESSPTTQESRIETSSPATQESLIKTSTPLASENETTIEVFSSSEILGGTENVTGQILSTTNTPEEITSTQKSVTLETLILPPLGTGVEKEASSKTTISPIIIENVTSTEQLSEVPAENLNITEAETTTHLAATESEFNATEINRTSLSTSAPIVLAENASTTPEKWLSTWLFEATTVTTGEESLNETIGTSTVLPVELLAIEENATTTARFENETTTKILSENLTETTTIPASTIETLNETIGTSTVLPVELLAIGENATTTVSLENATVISETTTKTLPENLAETTTIPASTIETVNETIGTSTVLPVELLAIGENTSENRTIAEGLNETSTQTTAAETTIAPSLAENGTVAEELNETSIQTTALSAETTIAPSLAENRTVAEELNETSIQTTTAETTIAPSLAENRTVAEELNETSIPTTALPAETTIAPSLTENITEISNETTQTTTEAPVSKPVRPGLLLMPPLRSDTTNEPEEEVSTTTMPEIVKAVSQYLNMMFKETTEPSHEEVTTVQTTPEPPVEAVSHLIETLINRPKNFETFLASTENPTTTAKSVNRTEYKDCSNGVLMFSAKVMRDFSQSFEMVMNVFTVQECVRTCHELQCSGAAFTRFPRPTCLLHVDHEAQPLSEMCLNANARSLYTEWQFESIPEVVQFDCIQCVNPSEEGAINITHFKQDNVIRELQNPQGITPKCHGRVEFQVVQVDSLPHLNTSNDVPANSPADCARLCLEKAGCSLAGFMPNPHGDGSNGVCWLTNDPGTCKNGNEIRPQHAAEGALLISCIKCSSCKYSISPVSDETRIESFEEFSFAFSIGQCAEECHKQKCTIAEYNPSTLICSMSKSPRKEPKCLKETAIDTFGTTPLLLDCVDCAA